MSTKARFVLAYICRFAPMQQVVCLHGGKDYSAPGALLAQSSTFFFTDSTLATTCQAILADEDKDLKGLCTWILGAKGPS